MPSAAPGEERPDTSAGHRYDALDGIHTIAVFLVALFHVSVPGFDAGFIGVDMFFVLSGYLITSGLLREFDRHGRIDLANFWARRIRRLMPAAALVLLVVLVWTVTAADPYRHAALGGDVWWTVFYLANWHFIETAGYFSADGTQSPLLHMWSLAVEEQFYIAWPLILTLVAMAVAFAARRRRASRRTTRRAVHRLPASALDRIGPVAAIVCAVLVLASVVVLAVLYDPAAPDRAYQGTDAKAFEPLLGALLAILVAQPGIADLVRRYARPLTLVGLVGTILLFTRMAGPAPLYFTGGSFVFCLATGALLLGAVYDRGGVVTRVLGSRVMAYLGRISYGLYLWHWPYAVWWNAHGQFRPLTALAVVTATIVTAAASYHLIEMPIRTGRLSRWLETRRTFAAAGATMALIAVGASALGGTPISPAVTAVLPKPALDPHAILVVGDSVPQRLMPALAPAAQERGLTVTAATAGGCSPLGVEQRISSDDEAGPRCPRVRDTQEEGLRATNPKTVLWWSRYEIADRFLDGRLLVAGTDEFWDAQLADFRTAVDRLTAQGATLVVVQTERPGIGMTTRCTASECHPFLRRMISQDNLRQHWNELVADEALQDPRLRTITMDDVLCRRSPSASATGQGRGGSALCDDTLKPGSVARPDGSHIGMNTAGAMVAGQLLDRARRAAADGPGN